MKKFLYYLLSIVFALTLCFGLVACGEHVHNFYYISNNDGTKVANCECGYSNVVIDENVLTVDEGFLIGVTDYGKTLTKIIIPNSIISIQSGAFSHCTSLESIVIPDNVQFIGSYAFEHCYLLTRVVIGSRVAKIPNSTFEDCRSLKNVTIGNNVINIGSSAFKNCYSLESIIIGNDSKLETIDNYAFSGCSSLKDIQIPNSITSIGTNVFFDCDNLDFKTENNLKYLGNSKNPYLCLIDVIPNTINNYVINATCKIIAGQVFYYDFTLKSIEIPDSVTSIGSQAFDGCGKLTSVTFGENSQLTSIGYCAFSDCDSIESIVIPDSVTSIGSKAFEYCNLLTSVTFAENCQLTSIGSFAFRDCRLLTSIEIPDSVTSIGSSVFSGCNKLTKITFTDAEFWYNTDDYDKFEAKRAGGEVNLNDPIENANYFKLIYIDYYWYKLT